MFVFKTVKAKRYMILLGFMYLEQVYKALINNFPALQHLLTKFLQVLDFLGVKFIVDCFITITARERQISFIDDKLAYSIDE